MITPADHMSIAGVCSSDMNRTSGARNPGVPARSARTRAGGLLLLLAAPLSTAPLLVIPLPIERFLLSFGATFSASWSADEAVDRFLSDLLLRDVLLRLLLLTNFEPSQAIPFASKMGCHSDGP